MQFKFHYLIGLSLIVFLSCSEDEPTPQSSLEVENFSLTIDENPQAGQVLGSISVLEASGPISYILSSQNPAGALNLGDESGELTVANAGLFNFEVNPVITAEVAVTDDNGSVTGNITINLNNIDESAMFNIWSGADITFTKAEGADPSLSENQDQISASVAITRGTSGGQIYNAVSEISANMVNSPAGTLWAVGTVQNIEALEFKKFRDAVGDPKNVVGKNLILYLEAEDVYMPLSFTMWSRGTGSGGGFSYVRATEN
jgi:hypothetical protein